MAEKVFDQFYLDPNSDKKPPFIAESSYLIGGEIRNWTGETFQVKSPIYYKGSDNRIIIGSYPMLTKEVVCEKKRNKKKTVDQMSHLRLLNQTLLL